MNGTIYKFEDSEENRRESVKYEIQVNGKWKKSIVSHEYMVALSCMLCMLLCNCVGSVHNRLKMAGLFTV